MLNDAQLVKHFPTLLKALKACIALLPQLDKKGIHLEEGASYTANRPWEQAFQVLEEEQRQHIVHRKFGLDLVCLFLEFFSQQNGIKRSDSVGMLYEIHTIHFPISSRIARDVLAIRGVSITVECLISSSKDTMSDAWSSMVAATVSATIVAKELLKAGFSEGLNYLEGITIH
ncbi:hypothetical protein DFH07DRAFT_777365 [Mycena maculata]|uniref:HAT C-terminal dimerisation domain-containing protein n=1 Tax=Mycena maculata TaxID=230809 RepID=A0AAD7N409_9AGAR|nr:hypothetical protein DFH07DRAFT_777365 [Mycena maculata]